MKLTREQAIEEHRKMWNWITDETLKRKHCVSKEDYFKEHAEYRKIPRNECWCCEYDNEHCCKFCPIDWGNEVSCMELVSCYMKWYECLISDDYEQAVEYARIVSELPER